jgi:hypothetical protein
MTDGFKKKARTMLDNLLGLKAEQLAESLQLKTYEAKDGSTISTDEAGKVQGEVADGEYELADGSTLVVADGMATQKKVEEDAAADGSAAEAEKPADAADASEAEKVDEPVAKAEPTMADVVGSLDALTKAITQALGLKDEALEAEKAKVAATEAKLAEAEKAVAEADQKAVDRKPGVGQGVATNLGTETKLKPWQVAQEQARLMR